MAKTRTKQTTFSEHDLAAAMPLNVPMDIRQIMEAMDSESHEKKPVAIALRKHAASGLLKMTPRSNRSNLWTRIRAPRREAHRKPDLPFDVMVAEIGGSRSSHYSADGVKPALVTLRAMPRLSIDG